MKILPFFLKKKKKLCKLKYLIKYLENKKLFYQFKKCYIYSISKWLKNYLFFFFFFFVENKRFDRLGEISSLKFIYIEFSHY